MYIGILVKAFKDLSLKAHGLIQLIFGPLFDFGVKVYRYRAELRLVLEVVLKSFLALKNNY